MNFFLNFISRNLTQCTSFK